MGLVHGVTQTIAGMATGHLSMAEQGLASFAAAMVPDYGRYSGPLYGDPSFQQTPYNTPVDVSPFHHDAGYALHGYPHTPTDVQLIKDVWNEPWVGPFGHTYRPLLTAGFGAKVLSVNPLAHAIQGP